MAHQLSLKENIIITSNKSMWGITVGAGPIVTQLGPVCAQIYALSARSKLTASRIVADELRQADIIITKTEYSDYLNKWLCIPY